MEDESTDYECNNYRLDCGAADENKILSGSVWESGCGGACATARLSEANGLSLHSRTTYWVPSVIGMSTGSCSIVPMGVYFDDTVRCSCPVVLAWMLFALRLNVETKDCATIVVIAWLPQLPFQSSLVRQSFFVPRTRMGSSPTN
jgi:hypothetical protein